ncbi:uncharacterized protein FIBRA_08953 [Fibroporia radiculosa]|uniref:Reverse transcriptase domain-containing protein n=1 Tax=Fibroporia radiculosa TaxID=599839 RepID=J4GIK7_9APHY|nr:uncharacterized protein FIBRA_08953 [Fibroporia radiculosa]CCM06668.1 predicted protein [Fibroporia radiculosa]
MSNNNSRAVNKPNQFEGDKGKSKELLDNLYLYFARNTKKIQTNKDEVQCALSYIKGPAQFFIHTIITDAEEPISDSDNAPPIGLPSWANFRKSFIQTFGVEDDTQAALNKITKLKELDTFIKENLRKGYIRLSKSPMASPFFFDYRKLNDATIKNAYPIPQVEDLLDCVASAKPTMFTKLDLCAGYNNVRIKEGDEWKGAFITPRGLFEPIVIFFGMTNSPATFQAMMDGIFVDLLLEGWLVIYIDDILIYSTNHAEHQQCTQLVLQHLKKSDLFLKPEKCFFDISEVKFLGFILQPGQIGMAEDKVSAVLNWPKINSVKALQQFLGFANFYL